MDNSSIAILLRNVASSYEYKDPEKYKFQIIAYNRAAESVEHATSELKDLWDDNKLAELPAIGDSIAKHLNELFETGKSTHFEEIIKDIPKEAFTLMSLPKIGLKTALKMIEELPESEIAMKIKEAKNLNNKNKRLLLPYAKTIASEVIEWLKTCQFIEKIDILGSLRRKTATVGDVDIAVATNNPVEVVEKFINYPKLQKIIEKGEHTASILLPNNVQVDLLVMDPSSYGSALQHFTGSKFHNIALREYSLKKGFSLSEYGLKKLDDSNKEIKKFENELDLYNYLGLDYIQPELREDMGEIQASMSHTLPELVDLENIKGDLQIHSNFDIETSHDLGINSMEDIRKQAKLLNYEYIAFTEHNPSKTRHTKKQIEDILKRKQEKIEQLNYSREKGTPFVFNSLEIDINKDGSLPISVKGLQTLDFALISIHSVFDLSKDLMTKRILNALKFPKVKILAHPTARRLNKREGVEIDWPIIFDFCKNNNKWIEINADPARLDLPDILVREAVKNGVKLTLGTDTHSIDMMNNMEYGVFVARRGWVQKKDMINCLSLNELTSKLKEGD